MCSYLLYIIKVYILSNIDIYFFANTFYIMHLSDCISPVFLAFSPWHCRMVIGAHRHYQRASLCVAITGQWVDLSVQVREVES